VRKFAVTADRCFAEQNDLEILQISLTKYSAFGGPSCLDFLSVKFLTMLRW